MAESYYAQILWTKQQLDYGIKLNKTLIKYDNSKAINLTKNLIQHSKTTHIEIRHYFTRDQVQNGNVMLDFVSTDRQLVDKFTKPSNKERFSIIRRELEVCNPFD